MSFFSRVRRFGNAFSSRQYRDFRRPYHYGEAGEPLVQQLPQGWNSWGQPQTQGQDHYGNSWVNPQAQLEDSLRFQLQQVLEAAQRQVLTQQLKQLLWQHYNAQPANYNYNCERPRYSSRGRHSDPYRNQFRINKRSHVIDSRKSSLATSNHRAKNRELTKKLSSYDIKKFQSDDNPEAEAERSQVNYLFLNFILEPCHYGSCEISYERLQPGSDEYLEVDDLITNKKNFIVDAIYKLDNPLLRRAYELKKEQKKLHFSHTDELKLFHGTTWINAENICRMNFNWRKCKSHKYGKGVSFSMNCNYAATYCDETTPEKVMILAKVLVSKSCLGNERMVLPPDGYDTSQKTNNEIVVVKYEDNEFLPLYKIYFHLMRENIRI